MPDYRSKTSTHGRNMAGARALWRATGVADSDFGKPIIAIANSFTQFVPGHVHLHNMGQLVARYAMQIAIDKAKQSGIGMVSVRNSNHYGIAAYYSSMAASQGLVGISMTNSFF